MPKGKKTKRRPVTVKEALKVVALHDVRVSPDGELVAFVKSVVRKDEKTRGTSIWAAPAGGGKVRQLTQGPEDGQPRWAPDGRMLAFTRKTDKEKPPQVFLLPLDGGEPKKLTDLQTAPEALDFAPNGRRISFLAETPDDKKTKQRKETGDDARVFVTDEKPKRLWTASLKSGQAKARSPEDLAVWEYDWLPDGRLAAVIFTEEPRLDALYFRASVGICRTKQAKIERLEVPIHRPCWPRVSPDGKAIAVLAGGGDSPFADQAWVVDIESGETTCLTPDLPATVDGLEWLPDSSGLLLLVAEGLLTRLCTAKLDAPGELERVCQRLPAAIDGVQISEDGSSVFAVGQDFEQAGELWCADLASGEARKLTAENKAAGKLRLGRSSVIRWSSTEDFEIDGALTLPPGFRAGEPRPTILVVHGGPAGRFREDVGLLPRQLLANEGYVVLTPNPRGSRGYGQEFMIANFQDWGGGDFRDLMAGLDALIEQGIADPERLGIYGGSYGGYMTAWTVTQTDRFRAAVCQCGLTDLYCFHGQTDITPSFLEIYFGASPYEDPDRYRARSAMTHIGQAKTPTLFVHGEQDVRVPIAQSYEMYWGLKHVEVETEFVIYPREGHGIMETPHQRDLYGRVVKWFGKHLKDGK